VNVDPVLPAALDTLEKFGDAGRFYYLDALTSATHPQDPHRRSGRT